jgi:hypothetical protein
MIEVLFIRDKKNPKDEKSTIQLQNSNMNIMFIHSRVTCLIVTSEMAKKSETNLPLRHTGQIWLWHLRTPQGLVLQHQSDQTTGIKSIDFQKKEINQSKNSLLIIFTWNISIQVENQQKVWNFVGWMASTYTSCIYLRISFSFGVISLFLSSNTIVQSTIRWFAHIQLYLFNFGLPIIVLNYRQTWFNKNSESFPDGLNVIINSSLQ